LKVELQVSFKGLTADDGQPPPAGSFRFIRTETSKSSPLKNGREKAREKNRVFLEKTEIGVLAIPRNRGNPWDSTWVMLEKVNNNAESSGKRGSAEERSSRDFDESGKSRINRSRYKEAASA
jgi:hypothetical protein